MNNIRNIVLIGTPSAREQAKCLLENQHQILRIDAAEGNAQLRLILEESLPDMALLGMLSGCGLIGVMLTK